MKIKKILVSQPKPTSEKSPYYDLIEKYGVEIDFRPFIKVEGVSSREFRQTKVPISAHTAVIFTARAAVDNYFRLCGELRFNVPDTMRYFCINEQIANYLQKYIIYRKRKIFFADGTPDDLVAQIVKHNKEVYLYPQSEVLESKLKGYDPRKIHIMNAIMYRTVSNSFETGHKLDYDMIVLFTPSGVKALEENFPNFNQGDIAIGAMGAKTLEEIEHSGLRLDLTTTHETPSMAAAIAHFIEQHADDNGGNKPENIAVEPVVERKPLPVLYVEPEPDPKKSKKKGKKTKKDSKKKETKKDAKKETKSSTKKETKTSTAKKATTAKKTTTTIAKKAAPAKKATAKEEQATA